MADASSPAAAPAAAAPPDPTPKMLAVLCALAAVVGVIVSLAAWCFLEALHQIQQGVFVHLPKDMGYSTPPWWWYVIVLAVAGFLAALAISRLPGHGGHSPTGGLQVGGAPILPIDVPGVILAALAGVGLGLVLGPEAPLLAMGAGLGLLAIRTARSDTPQQAQMVIAAAGSFAAISFLFDQPIIAAILVIEATGLARRQLPVILLPGLMASGIGSLVTIGVGKVTGLSTAAFALSGLPLPAQKEAYLTDFLWTIPLAALVAVGAFLVFTLAKAIKPRVDLRLLVLGPAAAMIVAGLAIAFSHITGKSADNVLFSGQDQLPGLVKDAPGWSVATILLLLGFKGLAWSLSLAGFRGGPTFPALFLGAAAGLLMSRLPGFHVTTAVAVGMGASVAAVLRLPLSAVVMATLLTAGTGAGTGPEVIVGVVIAYLVTIALSRRFPPPDDKEVSPSASPASASAHAAASVP